MTGDRGISGQPPAAEFDLRLADDVLTIVERFHGEWCNGGFAQLFSNWDKADVVLLPAALKMVGAGEASDIVAAVIGALPPGADWHQAGQAALLSSGDDLGEKLWAFDRLFDAHEAALWQCIEAYEAVLYAADDTDEVT